jgi:hypothetical protein
LANHRTMMSHGMTDDREVMQPCELCDRDRLHLQYRPIASVHFGEVEVPKRFIIEPGVCWARGGGRTKPNPEFLNIWEVGCEPIETRESVAESSYEVLEGDNTKEDYEGGERTMEYNGLVECLIAELP